MKWPEQAAKVRLTAKHATKIRKAFKSSIDGDALARTWEESHSTGGSISPRMARDWAQVHAQTNKKPMQNALASIYADGYVLGERIAKARLIGLKKDAQSNPTVITTVIDWANWKPGLPSAAALVKPRNGLRNLLDSRKITIADEVIHTKLDRIGTALSRSLEEGFTAKQTAQMIDTIINDPEAAMVIARTEMARATSVATRDSYENAGVEQVEWLVADGCDICQDNADASPIGIGDTFPSGDSEPPAHPNCECALAAYYDTSSDNTFEEEL